MIQVLPSTISNLIAAGEVVGRPASVVKELMENAIDAGAVNVTVVVLDAGRTMIQVIDDGCGMDAEEAVLCFERHATSKIAAAQDLEHIMTYGFRGEALASIAAVAEVTLKSRTADAETGTVIEISAGTVKNVHTDAIPKGTNIAVRNIFYNVPARRKFLKSDNAELKHIISEFTRVALTRYGTALKLTSNGKEIYNLRAVSNVKQRIHDIFGREFTNALYDVHTETSVVRVSGCICTPEDARKSSANQFFFVNGRYFRSAYFNKAVCRPFEKLIPEGYSPSYFIYLELDPENVDVNIHPAKTEVKFEDEPLIFEILMASVRESLGKNSLVPSIDFDMQGAPEIPAFNHSGGGNGYVAPPKIDYDPLFNPFHVNADFVKDLDFLKETDQSGGDPLVGSNPSYGTLFEEQLAVSSNILILRRKYIVTPVKSGLLIIDIKRARERIFFEDFYVKIAENQPVTQQSLFPEKVNVSAGDLLSIEENGEMIAAMGYDIRNFGGDSVVVYGVPSGFCVNEGDAAAIVDDLLAALRDNVFSDDIHIAMAESMARSAAASYRDGINVSEAQALVDRLFACREPSATHDGRKCMTTLPLEEIEKRL